jgi:hypothetical protein
LRVKRPHVRVHIHPVVAARFAADDHVYQMAAAGLPSLHV